MTPKQRPTLLQTIPRESLTELDVQTTLAHIFDGALSDGATIFGDHRGHYYTKVAPPFTVTGGDGDGGGGGITLNYAWLDYETIYEYLSQTTQGTYWIGGSGVGSSGIGSSWEGVGMFPVLVTQSGGSAGNLTAPCSYTYTVTTLGGVALGAGALTPDKFRPAVGPMVAPAAGSYGTGFYDNQVFHLFDANEVLDAAGCSA